MIFLLGRPHSQEVQEDLDQEAGEHGDILQVLSLHPPGTLSPSSSSPPSLCADRRVGALLEAGLQDTLEFCLDQQVCPLGLEVV